MTQPDIERLAVSAVNDSITICKRLNPFIDQNDKKPSWDGDVLVHNCDGKTKRGFDGRVHVQVKGHECEDHSSDTIKFQAEVADLRNYYLDGGAIYFVVYVKPDGQQKRIYYASLTMNILQNILGKCKNNQETRVIELKAFPQNEAAKFQIFYDMVKASRPTVSRTEDVTTTESSGLTFATTSAKLPHPLLNEFICQRLSAAPINRSLIHSFRCNPNTSMEQYLRNYAWEADTKGTETCYLVKSPANEVIMYFTLKCGNLFDQVIDAENLSNDVSNLQEQLLQMGMQHWNKQKHQNLLMQLHKKSHLLSEIRMDRQIDPTRNTTHVFTTYPAVELMHFCISDNGRAYWRQLSSKYPFLQHHMMGTTLFWLFVAPTIAQIKQIIGCQYVYTYVADISEDGKLVQYYQERLHFRQDESLCVNKPQYDFGCVFMCQEIETLLEHQHSFVAQLNADSVDI